MTVANFIPEIWSAKLLTATSTTHVGAAICNRDYEGDVGPGGTVNITSITDPTISSYTGAEFTFEDIDDATRALVIDQKKMFAFAVDDVDKAQVVNGGTLVAEAMNRAAYGLANTLDSYLLDLMVSGVSATTPDNKLEETTITTVGKAYEKIVDLVTLLDESDVPQENRWVVVPPAFYAVLLKDDRFVASGDTAAAQTRSNGFVGETAGLRVYRSNNLPVAASGTSATNKWVVAGSTYATTLAEQISKVEAVRLEKVFADGVKGLHVYGAKVLRPEFLAITDVNISIS